MAFTATDVKTLRERTGCGMMDCKKALTETDGDMDKAIEILREKGLAAVAKKAGRVAAEGIVAAMVEGRIGTVIEVNAETDFVAKNADFVAFVNDCAATVIKENPADVDALMNCTIAGGTMTVSEALTEKIQTIGENMKIRRFSRYDGDVITYVHGAGKIGVMVRFETNVGDKDGFEAYAKDIAMQIAAVAPQFIDESQVPADRVEKEKEILTVQAMNEGKPKEIAEKMVMGRIKKFFKEICLVDQLYVKNDKMSIAEFTAETAKTLGGAIKIVDFTRFELGEGIEKREDNFAEEVAKMTK